MEKRLFLVLLLSAAILCGYNILLQRLYKQREESVKNIREEQKEEKKVFKVAERIHTEVAEYLLDEEGNIISCIFKKYKEEEKPLKIQSKNTPLVLLHLPSSPYKKIIEGGEALLYFDDGLKIKKRYKMELDKYFFELLLHFHNAGQEPIKGRNAKLVFQQDTLEVKEVAYFLHGKKKVKKDFKGTEADWIGKATTHFAFLILSEEKASPFFEKTHQRIGYSFNIPSLSPGEERERKFRIYIGPKEHRGLHSFHEGAEELVGINPLSLFVLYFLNLFYRITHNYGVAIILLTILVKVMLFPLSHKSIKAMRSMQALGKKIEMLRQRYGENPQRLQQEILQLYRREGISPLTGCLPLILQIPIFYALFVALTEAVELKGQGFIFWIKDLSEKDPLYILPLLMGITMFLQQRMSPQDPRYKHFNIILPIIFTIMFCSFPSGIVLYWLVQNVLSILHQVLIEKRR